MALHIPACKRTSDLQSAKSAIYIAECDSIGQLAMDLAILPGAGISNIEVVTIPQETGPRHFYTNESTGGAYVIKNKAEWLPDSG
jgi:hypothetical protein